MVTGSSTIIRVYKTERGRGIPAFGVSATWARYSVCNAGVEPEVGIAAGPMRYPERGS